MPGLHVRHALTVVALAAAWTLGCGQGVDRHPQAHTWTLFDIDAAFQAGGSVAGMPASGMLGSDSGSDRMITIPCFGEGAPCGYVTVELRQNVAGVWVQPLYAQVTANADGSYTPVTAPLLVDVGPDSTFYSPFWELKYAVVPAGTSPDRFHSTRELLDAGVPIMEVAPHTCPLRPTTVRAAADGSQDVGENTAWLDGKMDGVFDFGPYDFVYADDTGMVQEFPLFQLVKGSDPSFAPPKVVGVGPIGSGATADVTVDAATGRPYPRFGTFWRIFDVSVPDAAAAFHLAAQPAAALAARTDIAVADYEGRVALDGGCFANTAGFPTACTWLDSQSAVESNVGEHDIESTDITAVYPLVRWAGKPVKRP
jgi:hypothetical protein